MSVYGEQIFGMREIKGLGGGIGQGIDEGGGMGFGIGQAKAVHGMVGSLVGAGGSDHAALYHSKQEAE
jgi:hypothetical protein